MSQQEQMSSVATPMEATSLESAQGQPRSNSAVSRQRTVIAATVLVFLVGLLGWQIHVRRDFWQSAWSARQTFRHWAECASACEIHECSECTQPEEFSRDWLERTIFFGEPSDLTLAQFGAQPQRSAPFDLSNATVPANEIRSGGPTKDGIPALTNPTFIDAKYARYLLPEDRVIGFVAGNEARAYPLRILDYHEIVNDRVADIPVAVTYCPLCDSAAIFDRRTPLGERDFGVSGLLHNSNVLMYDRGGRPESLWSQVKSEGISGPATEQALQSLPLELTTWQDWQSRYPRTKVLSPETGHRRDYNRNPYAGYFDQPRLIFPARPTSDRLPTKARVLGVWTGDAARAYPESAFSRQQNRVEERIGGKKVVIEFNPDVAGLRVAEADDGVQWM